MIGRILAGIVIACVGAAVMYYSARLTENFGPIAWAQKHLGSTRNGYLIFGFCVMIIGFLISLGVIQSQNITDVGSLQKP